MCLSWLFFVFKLITPSLEGNKSKRFCLSLLFSLSFQEVKIFRKCVTLASRAFNPSTRDGEPEASTSLWCPREVGLSVSEL